MTTEPIQNVSKPISQEAKKKKQKSSMISVRISLKTKEKVDQILRKANKEKLSKRIKPNDVFDYLVDNFNEDSISEIVQKKLSNKDKLELMFRDAVKQNKGLSKDEFLGRLLENYAPVSLKNQI